MNHVHGLKKAFPAAAGGITFIDRIVSRDVNKGTDVSPEISHGYFNMLLEHFSYPSGLYVFIQIMNRGLNLVYLHLNNLLMRIRQGKDLDRDTDLFQCQDLVQNKGL